MMMTKMRRMKRRGAENVDTSIQALAIIKLKGVDSCTHKKFAKSTWNH